MSELPQGLFAGAHALQQQGQAPGAVEERLETIPYQVVGAVGRQEER